MNKPTKRKTRANQSLENILRGMKYRTIYSRLPAHINCYISKGIRICDEWLRDAAAFDRWALANGWKEGLTIDRIDNDGNYEPSNCQFVTHSVNCQKRSTGKLTRADVDAIRARFLPGRGGNWKALAKEYGVSERHIHQIVKADTWKPE